jgi:hypothetical protein
MKNKFLKISTLVLCIILFGYISAFLSLRRTEPFDQQGSWVIYFYGKSFVRQYALDNKSKLSLKNAVIRGDTSFFVGHEGDVGEDWFCVYRKSNTKFYRIFGLAENIENAINFKKDKS